MDYKDRKTDESNLEVLYDLKGNRQLFEKVISNHPVKMNTEIKTDVDPSQGMLDAIKNPLQLLSID